MTDQMTNRNKHIQPARRPFNLLVRGGRLTRFKGRVASIAPGLAVVVLAAAAALFSGGGVTQAVAQQVITGACGDVVDGQVTCDAGTYTNGITYNAGSAGLTLILDDPNVDDPDITVVNTTGDSGVAVRGTSSTSGPIAVRMNHGSVTTDAVRDFNYSNHGLEAYTEGTGNATAQMNGGDVTTHDGGSNGLRAEIKNAESDATAKAELTKGSINIFGGSSSGLSAVTESIDGAAIVQMSGGKITMHAGTTSAINATSTNRQEAANGQRAAVATVTAEMTGGEIETRTEGSSGVVASSRGSEGNVVARMVDGKITTLGEQVGDANDGHAYAVQARIYGNVNSTAIAKAEMTGGVIETHAHNSYGLTATTSATGGEAIAEMTEADGRKSTITTHGAQAHGLSATASHLGNASEASATAIMRAGDIHIGGNFAHGLHVQANGLRSTAIAEMHGGSITLDRGASHGLRVRIDNPDHEKTLDNTTGVTALMTGGSILTKNRPNSFEGSHGIYADTTGSADVLVNMQGGTITTQGRNSHGLWAEAEAKADSKGVRLDPDSKPQAKTIVNLGADAVVTASGAGSNGIRVSGNYVTVDSDPDSEKFWLGVKEFDVDVAGIVTGGADGFGADDDGAAIRTISDADGGGTIDIASTAIVTAGGSGIAIQDGDGDAVVTLEGTVTGDIRLGAGDDSLTIAATASFDFSRALDGGAGDNDHLTLHGRRTMTSMENITGWEHLTLKDEMEMSLDGVTTVDMGLSIDATSTFRVSGGGRGTGATIAGKVARASGGGITISGDVTNAGDLTLSVQDGAAGDVITIDGDYTNTGSGRSVFELDAVGANTDRLEITGNASGEMVLSIAGLDSIAPTGAPLVMDVVTVDGASEDATFTLVGGNYVTPDGEQAVIAGAHLYTLADTGRGWALSALSETGETNYQPSAPVYDSYGQSLLALNGPKSLRNRGSSEDFRILAWEGGPATQAAGGSPLWLQMGADRITLSEENSTTGAALESTVWEMEIGADIVLIEIGSGLLVGGLMGSYATGSTDVSSAFGDGSIDTTGLGLGVAATWYDTRRFYVDGQMTLASYTSDLEADRLGTLTEENSGTGFAVSLEAGQQLDLGSRLTVIPQAQLSVSSVAFSDFADDAHGEQVTFENASSQQLRLGVEFGLQEQEARRFYGIMNLFHEFGAGSEVNVTGSALTTESEPWAAGVGLGGTYVWNDRLDLFGETSYTTGLGNVGDTSALSVNAGFKVTF